MAVFDLFCSLYMQTQQWQKAKSTCEDWLKRTEDYIEDEGNILKVHAMLVLIQEEITEHSSEQTKPRKPKRKAAKEKQPELEPDDSLQPNTEKSVRDKVMSSSAASSSVCPMSEHPEKNHHDASARLHGMQLVKPVKGSIARPIIRGILEAIDQVDSAIYQWDFEQAEHILSKAMIRYSGRAGFERLYETNAWLKLHRQRNMNLPGAAKEQQKISQALISEAETEACKGLSILLGVTVTPPINTSHLQSSIDKKILSTEPADRPGFAMGIYQPLPLNTRR